MRPLPVSTRLPRGLLMLLALLPLASGCKSEKSAPPSHPRLLSEVKAGLDKRDRKLSSYSLKGQVNEAGQEARYTFHYRAPGRMKGTLTSPLERTFAYDGKTLFEVDPVAKKLTRFSLDASKEQSSFLLNQVFAAFVSEGYRAPLLVREGVSAEHTTHPLAPEAVKVTQTAKADTGEVTVSYVLRWPSLDFLEKTVTSGGTAMQVRVEEEHCDAKLALCVPKRLSQWQGQERVATTELTDIQLNPAIPADDFTLELPEGFTEERRSM